MNKHFIPYNDKFREMNTRGMNKEGFYFIIDFDATSIHLFPLDSNTAENRFHIEPFHKKDSRILNHSSPTLSILEAVKYEDYRTAMEKVLSHIQAGNTYLLNLTDSVSVKLENTSLKDIFAEADAPYKFLIPGKAVCFSPEEFVTIKKNTIFTHPMKGTSDKGTEASLKALLSSKKELAEHYTIVDLLRNDLSIIAENVKVNKFRYPSKIHTQDGGIWQTSSEISGSLQENWQSGIGDILYQLLPAGSITGAPKKKTTEIINGVEHHHRGYYTGIFGVFTGENLYSAVAIRYIEKKSDTYFYKTGGGITSMSDIREEYEELMRKVYIPLLSNA